MSKSLTPQQRSQRARIAAHTKWAHTDPVAGTAAARARFLETFIEQVDPERKLPEAERLRRAESARSAYFAALAYKSARKRQSRRADQGGAP